MNSESDLCTFLETNKSRLKLKGMNPSGAKSKQPKPSVPKQRLVLPKWRSKRKSPTQQVAKGTQQKDYDFDDISLSNLVRFRDSIKRANKVGAHFVQGGRTDSARNKH
jgi:hypothetical protein